VGEGGEEREEDQQRHDEKTVGNSGSHDWCYLLFVHLFTAIITPVFRGKQRRLSRAPTLQMATDQYG
jgi:hypothetical protein